MVEGTQGIGHIHTLAAFGSIDLERFGKIDGQAHLAGQLNAQNTVFQHIGMKDKRAVAVENLLDMRLLVEVIRHTHNGYHVLLSARHHHSLPLHNGCIDGYTGQLLQLLQAIVVSLDGVSFGQRDAQLGVESRKEAGHKVVKAVKDTQRTNECHSGNGHTHHRDAADDIDGIVALLTEDIPTGYEKREVQCFRSSSMCST